MFGKAKDPVCGMKVKKKEASATLEHGGKTYYFCSDSCKKEFIKNPAKYVGSETETKSMGHGCH